MELSAYIVWNVFITLVLAPLLYSIRQNSNEIQRLGILLNKTREDLAREYVTKQELRDDMTLLMDRIQKIDEKLDKLFERQ
jgi:hypothetical protein